MNVDLGRTPEQLKHHYEVEKELAARLRAAGPDERPRLYSWAYEELFRQVADHPLLRKTEEDARRAAAAQLTFLRRFLKPDIAMIEIGPGDCALAFLAAAHLRKVVGVDVMESFTPHIPRPENFEMVVYDGIHLPLPDASFQLAYSNQVVEHLHPDDVLEQTRSVCRVLVPGGIYVCATPNRITGPHDVSGQFDDVATCLHLKEYTTGELHRVFREAGFSRTVAYAGLRGHYGPFPWVAVSACEALLGTLPHRIGRAIARRLPLRIIEGIRLVGFK